MALSMRLKKTSRSCSSLASTGGSCARSQADTLMCGGSLMRFSAVSITFLDRGGLLAHGAQVGHRFARGFHGGARAVFDLAQRVGDVDIVVQRRAFIDDALHAHRNDADEIVDAMQ